MSHERAKAARRAGSSPEYIEGLVELGILSPQADGTFTTGDVERRMHGAGTC